jgi:hypothetical protein
MNKAQARILLINARVLQLLPYRDNESFLPEARACINEIEVVFYQLTEECPRLTKALETLLEYLKSAILALPACNSYTTPDPVPMRASACIAIVELAKLTDE